MRPQAIVAMSGNLTLYVAVPKDDGEYRTLRSRVKGRASASQTAEFDGGIAGVAPVDDEESVNGGVRCGSVLLTRTGEPGPGQRLAVGIREGEAAEVSSPLAWRLELPSDRTWLAEPLIRAYKNGDRRWQEMLLEQSYELGDEEVEEEDLRAEALDRYYQSRLEAIAKRRQARCRRHGFTGRPLLVPVSNEHLKDALDLAVGHGLKRARLPLRDRRVAGRVAASIDQMLATLKTYGAATATEELPLAA